MTNETHTDGAFERRARAVFEASLESVDAHARSRLNQARQAATAAAERPRRSPWLTWAPAGALAAVTLLAVLVWRLPEGGDVPAQQAQAVQEPAADAQELLSEGDDLDLVSEDLEFYEWVAAAADDPDNGVG